MAIRAVVQDVVQEADAVSERLLQILPIDPGLWGELLRDERGQIDASQIAATVGLQGDFGAGVGSQDLHSIILGGRLPLDCIPEDDPRLG